MSAEPSQPANSTSFIEFLKTALSAVFEQVTQKLETTKEQDVAALYKPSSVWMDSNEQTMQIRKLAETIAALSVLWLHQFYRALVEKHIDEATAKRTFCQFIQLRMVTRNLFYATQPATPRYDIFAYEALLLKPFYAAAHHTAVRWQWDTLGTHPVACYAPETFDTKTITVFFKDASAFLLNPDINVIQNDMVADIILRNSLYHSSYREALTNYCHLRLTQPVEDLFSAIRDSTAFHLESFSMSWHDKMQSLKNRYSQPEHRRQALPDVLDHCFLQTFHEMFIKGDTSWAIANLLSLFDIKDKKLLLEKLMNHFPASLMRKKYFPCELQSDLLKVLDHVAQETNNESNIPDAYFSLKFRPTTWCTPKEHRQAQKLSKKDDDSLKETLTSRIRGIHPLCAATQTFWYCYRIASHVPMLQERVIKTFVVISNQYLTALSKPLWGSKRYATSTQQGRYLWQTTSLAPETDVVDTKAKALAVCRRYVNGDIDKFLGIFYWRSDTSLGVMQHLIREFEKPENDLPELFVKINGLLLTPHFRLSGRACGILRVILQEMQPALTQPAIPTPSSH